MRELEIVDDEKYWINSFNKNKNDNNNSIDGIGIGKQQEQTTQNIRSALTLISLQHYNKTDDVLMRRDHDDVFLLG